MALLRRRPRDSTAATDAPQDPRDAQTLAAVRELIAEPEAPRDRVHDVHCATDDRAEVLSVAASRAGWSVHRAATAPGIIASRRDLAATPSAVAEQRAFFTRLAASVPGGDDDGWKPPPGDHAAEPAGRRVSRSLYAPDAAVEFRLLTEAEGGLHDEFAAEATVISFPLFGRGATSGWDVRIWVDGVRILRGRTYLAPAAFLSGAPAARALPPGTHVDLWQGRTVGAGTIRAGDPALEPRALEG